MVFEEILSTLKTKIGETNLSDRTITDYIKNNPLEEGKEPDEEFFVRHSNILKSLSGQYRHDIAKTIEELKAKREKPSLENESNENKEMKELLERIKALEEKSKNDSEAYKAELTKRELVGKADELKVSNKNLWEDVASSMDFGSFKTHDEALLAVKKVYEEKLSRYAGGAQPYGRSNGGGEPSEEEMKRRREAYKKKLAEEDGK